MYYLGFDIGGSSVKAVLVKNKKTVRFRIDKLPKNFKALVDLITEIATDLTKNIKPRDTGGIGFAIAGALDLKREKMLKSPNIRYLNNQPIKEILQKKLKYPIKIEHDVNCFLLAEKKVGLAKNFKNVFYLTLGTGIGGAFMIDGKIFLGAHGSAGEAGHTIMKFKTQSASWRTKLKTYDLEELASNKFIKKSLGIGSIEALKRAKTGDKKAIKTFTQLGKNLGIGIANIINIFDPEAIIFSGGIADAKEFILPGIKKGIKKFIVSPSAKKTKILFGRLGRHAGALGASFLFDK